MSTTPAGGYEYDGATEISTITDADAAHIAEQVVASGAEAAVVCGVHAPVNPAQELAMGRQLQQLLPQMAGGPTAPSAHAYVVCAAGSNVCVVIILQP